jgi:copper chaperone CopZ
MSYEPGNITMTQEMTVGKNSSLRIKRVTFPIHNLGCGGGGSLTVERTILRVEGVRNAYVNPAIEMAYVEFDPSRCTPDALIKAVEHVGFRAGAPVIR